MTDKDLSFLFRETKEWEKFLDWNYVSSALGFRRYISITLKETGEVLGKAYSLKEMDEVAEQILNDLFEKEVLSGHQ